MAKPLIDITEQELYEEFDDYPELEPFLTDEPFVEDIVCVEMPAFEPDFSDILLIDGIPVITANKAEKLASVLSTVFAKVHPKICTNADDLYIPFGDDGKSYGAAFLRIAPSLIERFTRAINGVKFDKNHTMKVSPYSLLKTVHNFDENTQPPADLISFQYRPEVESWLCDELCRDQFAIRHDNETEVYWFNPGADEEPTMVNDGSHEVSQGRTWSDLIIDWSPKGTFFITYHKRGIKLWGGKDMELVQRFQHANCVSVKFSPCETYVLTSSVDEKSEELISTGQDINIWDVRTGNCIRFFPLKDAYDVGYYVQTVVMEDKDKERIVNGIIEKREGNFFHVKDSTSDTAPVIVTKHVTPLQNPNVFKWSSDGRFLAALGTGVINVYEMPACTLYDSKSFPAKNVTDFHWSPKNNFLCYWCPAALNAPASINVLDAVSRTPVASRSLYHVVDMKMYWQDAGDFLAVAVTTIAEKKKQSHSLLIFRTKDSMRGKNGRFADVPIETLSFGEQPITNVSWEPKGERVLVVTGESRTTIHAYSMTAPVPPQPKGKGKNVKAPPAVGRKEATLLFTKTGVPCSGIFWSPAGNVVVLANFSTETCLFHFLNINEETLSSQKRHDRCSTICWDPSGRFLATATVISLRNLNARGHPQDGVNFYSFQGTLLSKITRPKLFSFVWRPRPEVLTEEETKAILADMSKFEQLFEQEDKQRKQELKKDAQQARYKRAEKFLAWSNKARAAAHALKSKRIELRGGYDSDDDNNYTITTISEEQIVKETLLH